MRILSSFRDAKTRLQALAAFITIPVVLIVLILAVIGNRLLSSSIDRNWREYTDDYALFMLAALYFAYSRAIQSEILQWIDRHR